jgi:group I intron endonuclease
VYTIYLVTNKKNGKVYVGQTSQSPDARWRNHQSCAKRGEDNYFYRAIRQHGSDNFSIDLLSEVETKTDADYLEHLFILCLKANDREFGYVGTEGGDGRYNPNKETRQKRKETILEGYRKGRKPTKLRKDISTETIIELYRQGGSHREIAKQLNCSPSMIKSRLQKVGFKCRPVSFWRGRTATDGHYTSTRI